MTDWSFSTYRRLLEGAPDAVVAVNLDGRIVFVNAQTEHRFGYHDEELIGQPVEILVPEVAREVHPSYRERYLQNPQPRVMGAGSGLTVRRKDGSEFPSEISICVIDTEDGSFVLACIRDVTERGQVSQAEATLAAIVRSSHDAIISKTLDGVITSWNPGAERIYGYHADEMVGRTLALLIPPDRQKEEQAVHDRVARGERMEGDYLAKRVRKDGTVIDVSLRLSPVIGPTGALVGVASVARDVTERQRAEARFHGLLEAAPDAIVAVDQEGRIALANAQAERLFGYERDHLLGRPMGILISEASRATYSERHAAYYQDPTCPPSGGIQLAVRRRDGSECPIEASWSALDTEEGLLVCTALRDISERLEAQAEQERLRLEAERERMDRRLQQSERLESLGQLAGGVAHDFNNLLAVILNYSAFVAEVVTEAAAEAGGEAWRSVQKDVVEIRRAAERAADLTRQLLAFGRGDVVRPKSLDLNLVVAGVEELLRRSIGEHVTLVTSLAPGLAPVIADAGRIEQVLVNLAVNARDAMPEGGTLTIDTANLVVDEQFAAERPGINAGPYVRLRVSDTGTGMSKDVVARAFEPFFTTKPKGEGTGLGLSTVYGIITQLGGYASIYSEPGLGTTFNAFFPATDQMPTGTEESIPRQGSSGRETVLVVEDADAMREVARRMLARNGYTVLTAASGQEALRIAGEHEGDIHLLLTDVVMPQMLGKEVAERMGQLRPGLRVLYMSGYAQPVFAARGTLEPGVTLLEKPFSEAVLVAKVRQVLEDEG